MSQRLAFILLFIGSWLFLVLHLSQEWWHNPQYGYGLVVPLLCAGILWLARSEIASSFGPPPPGPPPRSANIIFCAAALLIFPLELYRQIAPGLRGFGFGGAVLLYALTYWTLRHLGMKKFPQPIWGAALLFATAIPWPSTLEVVLIQGLMRFTAALTAEVMNWVGVLAVARGNLIELENGVVGVDEACSGVRSLQACFMSAVAVGVFFRIPAGRFVSLIIFGFLLALLGNLFRSLILTGVAATRGLPAIEKFHDPAGWTILIGVTLVLYWIGLRWRGPDPAGRSVDLRKELEHLGWSHLPRARAAFGIALAGVLGAHVWYSAHEYFRPARATPSLTLREPSGTMMVKLPLSDTILGELQPHSGASYQVEAPGIGNASVYYFFWEPSLNNRAQFFHRPDVCMPGAGWEPDGPVKELTIPLGNTPTRWYLFQFKRGKMRILQAWGVWRDGDDQTLNFEGGWKKLWGQQLQRFHFIEQGKRVTNTEIASVAIGAQDDGEQKLIRLIQELFTFNPGPP